MLPPLLVQIDKNVAVVPHQPSLLLGPDGIGLLPQIVGIDQADLVAGVQDAPLASPQHRGVVDRRAVARRVLEVHLHLLALVGDAGEVSAASRCATTAASSSSSSIGTALGT